MWSSTTLPHVPVRSVCIQKPPLTHEIKVVFYQGVQYSQYQGIKTISFIVKIFF